MRENLILQVSEIHRSAMESHMNYISLIQTHFETIIPQNNNEENQNNPTHPPLEPQPEYLQGTSGYRLTTLPPITLDLSAIFSTVLNNTELIPTTNEINESCETLLFSELGEDERTTDICPIDRQTLEMNDRIMRINHCKHYFRETSLRQNFMVNSLCPLCRHNIISSN
jgi:hypothetical protein